MPSLIGNNPNQVPSNGDLGRLAFKDYVGISANLSSAPTLASASTIQPTTPVTFVSGTSGITTITPPADMVGSGSGSGAPNFGTVYAGQFNGSSYINVAPMTLATSTNFTIESWVYSSGGGSWCYLSGNTASYAAVRVDISSVISLLVSTTGGDWQINYNTPSIPANTWFHLALVRNGSSFTFYLNGTQLGTTQTLAGTLYSGTIDQIGAYNTGSAGNFFNGYMTNFRVVNGTAVYTSDFVSPTSILTAVSGTQLLTLQNATIVDNSTNAYSLTNSGVTIQTTNVPSIIGAGGSPAVPATGGGGGQITLIPTGGWSTTTAGNIALATTAVVNKALILTWDTTTAKWYPSY